MNAKNQLQTFISIIDKALTEMETQQVVLLKRGDLIEREKLPLFKEMYEEIKEIRTYLETGGAIEKAYRHLQMNVFMKHEAFFMDLFETKSFPELFELFEYE